jgi:hypothetical protein
VEPVVVEIPDHADPLLGFQRVAYDEKTMLEAPGFGRILMLQGSLDDSLAATNKVAKAQVDVWRATRAATTAEATRLAAAHQAITTKKTAIAVDGS